MTPENFCYWLQGFAEIQNPIEITKEQVQVIKDHLKLVFTKVTPTYTATAKLCYDKFGLNSINEIGDHLYYDTPDVFCSWQNNASC